MKIAIISDTHFGFKEKDSELCWDCYINAYQAFELALKNKADAIIMPGDIFDSEIPTQETFERTFSLLNTLIGQQELAPKNKDKTITALPIVVIAGTHEFRGKDYKGPIDVLESAKYIYKLEKEFLIIERDNERVAIHGMKGVPEKVAKDLLIKLDFKPVENAKNIIMLHQSFKEFLPFDDEMVATLKLEDLPKGFDLYVNGHIHLSNIIDTEYGKFLLPGSTILTQIKKKELEKPKGIYIYESNTNALEFLKIPIQREYFLKEINAKDETKEQIREKIKQTVNETITKEREFEIFDKKVALKSILKIKLSGTVKAGYKQSDVSEKDFSSSNLILIIEKDLDSKELEEKIKEIDIAKEKEIALKQSTEVFIKNLEAAGFKKTFNPEEVLELLRNNDLEKATETILKKTTN